MTSESALAPPSSGLSGPVLAAAACFAVGAGSAASLMGPAQYPLDTLFPLGWAVFAIGGAVLLDRRVAPLLARTLTALALVPLAVLAFAVLTAVTASPRGELVGPTTILQAFVTTAPLQAVAVLVGVPLAARPAAPRRSPAPRRTLGLRRLAAGVAVLGALAATLPSLPAAVRAIGWGALVLGCLAVWVEAVLDARAEGRTARRRTTWLVASLAAGALVVAASAQFLSPTTARTVTTGALALQAIWTTQLALRDRFRPLDEHLLDVALVGAGLAAAVGVGAVLRLGATLTRMPSPDTSATMGAVLTAAAAAPAALWVRRTVLGRRYGPGAIPPSDVAVITEDLHARADPRVLLDKAARMVAAASGCRDARLVLGAEPPEVPATWVVFPLDIGGERVGSLAVEAAGAEGLEPRQADDVARLVPTVALVTRAVTLAVEAELARRDVTRERDLERRRILADLHDGLGPVLAGMSMRVRAALRASGEADHALLGDLAESLAASRTDLRRIVSGITPSALEDGDLAAALERLVASFRRPGPDGPSVSLEVTLDQDADRDVQVTVYRCVAEGVTNALRHANASAIRVAVVATADRVCVEVVDDGVGGAAARGVGLSSLHARAESIGGVLTVQDADPGTALRLWLPTTDARIPA